MPTHRPGVPSVQAAVRADLEQREQVGIRRYGTPLQPVNGRDALRDAYDEALDLACYLRQEITERGDQPVIALQLAEARQKLQRQDDLIAELRRQLTARDRLVDRLQRERDIARGQVVAVSDELEGGL